MTEDNNEQDQNNNELPGSQDVTSIYESEIENLKAEKNALFEKLARSQAEFQNARKRLEADLEKTVQLKLSKLVDNMLPVIDNFERALGMDSEKTDSATIIKGMTLVHDQWLDILKRFAVEAINPPPGTEMDPHQHQAVMQEHSDHPAGTITKVAQKGYTLNGKPLRPAMVIVSKGPG